jgi:hypothetical protein
MLDSIRLRKTDRFIRFCFEYLDYELDKKKNDSLSNVRVNEKQRRNQRICRRHRYRMMSMSLPSIRAKISPSSRTCKSFRHINIMRP